MYAKLLPAEYDTAYLVSRLLYEKHIYSAIGDDLKDVYFAHRFLCEIENGIRLVLGVFSPEDEFLGCVHGKLTNGVFVSHVMFKRNVDAVKACLLCQNVLQNFCEEKRIALNEIVGYPPVNLRAAVLMNKRFGCVQCGIAKDVVFYANGENVPCFEMRKDLTKCSQR